VRREGFDRGVSFCVSVEEEHDEEDYSDGDAALYEDELM